jgi:hypothetical protein
MQCNDALIQVEGLADLIESETKAQREQAAVALTGVSSSFYDDLEREILDVRLHFFKIMGIFLPVTPLFFSHVRIGEGEKYAVNIILHVRHYCRCAI